MKKLNNKGFTLVELLVVIAIIGILAVVAVPALFKNIEKSKVAKLEEHYNVFKSATIQCYADENNTPNYWEGGPNDLENYIDSIPSPPNIGDKYEVVSNEIINNENRLNIPMIKFNSDGTIIYGEQGKVKLEGEGEVFLLLRSHGNKPLNISDEQLKKICNDIGYKNIYIYSSNKLYNGNILAIKLIDKI